MNPGPERMAIHQAGHAVVQTLVGRQRCTVARVSLDGPHCESWQGRPASGESYLDREVFFSLYEFGLVTLAGIAAEECIMAEGTEDGDPVVALSDLAAWQEQAWGVLQDEARVNLVSHNIMRKLHKWLDHDVIWQVVERLAGELLAQGTLVGEALQLILAPLRTWEGESAGVRDDPDTTG